MTPRRIYSQVISNHPSSTWLTELRHMEHTHDSIPALVYPRARVETAASAAATGAPPESARGPTALDSDAARGAAESTV
jgi:hypothetical protein